MPVIQVKQTNVHIQEINAQAKESVLMIHGMFSNLSLYYFKIAPIIARNYRVVMYDLKSHGMSEKVTTGYDLNSMTDELLALMNSLSFQSTHLVGYSYGGLVALKMAIRFPEKVKKLAIIEAPDPSEQETLNKIHLYSRESLAGYVNNSTDTKRRMGKRQLERNHQMYEFFFKETTMRDDMHSEKDFFADTKIEDIQHQTLLIYGKNSDCVPAGNELYNKIKNARLIFMDGDHTIPVQQPVTIGNALKAFFENQ